MNFRGLVEKHKGLVADVEWSNWSDVFQTRGRIVGVVGPYIDLDVGKPRGDERKSLEKLRVVSHVLRGIYRLDVSRVLSVVCDGMYVRCVLKGTSAQLLDYDDPSEPLVHEAAQACAIHDKPQWRLWSFHGARLHRHRGFWTYKRSLASSHHEECSCGRRATAIIDWYGKGALLMRSAAVCGGCGMKINPFPEAARVVSRRGTGYQPRCRSCLAWLPPAPSVKDGEGREIGYRGPWTCVVCGAVYTKEDYSLDLARDAERLLRGGLRSESTPRHEPGSIEEAAITDPDQWANSARLSSGEKRLVRASWSYVRALASHRVAERAWDLHVSLLEQDLRGVHREAARCLAATTNYPSELASVVEDLKHAVASLRSDEKITSTRVDGPGSVGQEQLGNRCVPHGTGRGHRRAVVEAGLRRCFPKRRSANGLGPAGNTRERQTDMANRVTLDGIEVTLAEPDDHEASWLDCNDYVHQLEAAWLRLRQDELPLNPRIVGDPGLGKTTFACAVGRKTGREVYIFQCTMDISTS